MKVPVYSVTGQKSGEGDLSDALFGLTVKKSVLHQTVVWQLARRRAGTASTKTVSEVRGGGRKPWKQKGTGRARAGSTRSNIWRHGGVSHGPKPKSWATKLPKRVRKLAVRMAIANRIQGDALGIIETVAGAEPRARWAKDFLKNIVQERILIVTATKEGSEDIRKAFSNIPNCDVLPEAGLNVYDILNHSFCLIEQGAIEVIENRLTAGR